MKLIYHIKIKAAFFLGILSLMMLHGFIPQDHVHANVHNKFHSHNIVQENDHQHSHGHSHDHSHNTGDKSHDHGGDLFKNLYADHFNSFHFHFVTQFFNKNKQISSKKNFHTDGVKSNQLDDFASHIVSSYYSLLTDFKIVTQTCLLSSPMRAPPALA